MWSVALCCVVALVVVKVSHWLYRWSNPKSTGKLPPGSMGFPIIGETFEYFRPFGFYEIPPFVKKRMSRYGPLFRTNIFCSETVFSTDPEVNLEILKQENKSFVIGYPDGFLSVFGKEDNLFLKQGNIHKCIRQLSQQLLGAEGLKRKIIHDMDKATREHLRLKATEGIFDVKDAVTRLIVGYMTSKVTSGIKPEVKSKLIDCYSDFNLDWFRSFLTLSSWKALYKVFMARRNAIDMIKDILTSRKASSECYDDFMDTMLGELEKQGTVFNEDAAINLMFLIAVLSHETISITTTLLVKLISENPKVVVELKREHDTILRNRADKESGVTWEEYKSMMTFTHMVINESLRLGNLVLAIFRKAVKDVEIKGYTIPAGWVVAIAPSVLHYDPETFENPFEFNPWRWEGKEVLSGSKRFMAFGGALRLCAGAEFARLQMAVFVHYLVTEYDFSLIGDGEITRTPLLHFPKPIRIKIFKSSK